MNADAGNDAALHLDLDGRIARDLPCRHCGYNLRGIALDGVCPECARPVRQSVGHDYLRNCDPKWVDSLLLGMNLIIGVAVVGFIGACLLGVITSMLMRRPRPLTGNSIMLAFQFVLMVVSYIGYWKLTTPDPGRTEPESNWSARRLVRITQVLGIVVVVLTLLSLTVHVILTFAINIVAIPIGPVFLVALLIYARQIALRIPNQRLAWHVRTLMWVGGAVVTLVMGGAVIMMISAIATITAMGPIAGPRFGPTGSMPAGSMPIGYFTSGSGGMSVAIAPTGVTTHSADTGDVATDRGTSDADTSDAGTNVLPTVAGSIRGGQVLPRGTRATGSAPAAASGPFGIAASRPAGPPIPPGFLRNVMLGGALMMCFSGSIFVILIWALVIVVWFRSALSRAAEEAHLNQASASASPPPVQGGAA